jgi:hypothetical protein
MNRCPLLIIAAVFALVCRDIAPVTAALAKRIMLSLSGRLAFSLLVGLFLLIGLVAADSQEKRKATLVETHSEPRCYGLDCPPWPAAPNIAFCFQVGDAYYTATDRSWGLSWANTAMKLRALQGQSVDIVVTEGEIKVIGPKVKVRLWVVHNYLRFKLDGCQHG